MTAMMEKASPAQQRLMTLRDLMERSKAEIAKVVPKHLTADRLVKVALSAASRTPMLLQCTPKSILLSVMHCAQLGLEAGSPLGSAYLVPFRNNKTGEYEAIPIVGYRGLIDLARRSGQIESIEAHVVYEGDAFECAFGIAPVLTHVPKWDAEGGRKIKAAYAVAKFKGGGYQAEVMTVADVDAVRSRSRASGQGPWVSDYSEMARKTVVRRLCKYLPLTVELATALETEEHVEAGESIASAIVDDLPEVIETEAVEQKPATATGALAAKLGGNGSQAATAEAAVKQTTPPTQTAAKNEVKYAADQHPDWPCPPCPDCNDAGEVIRAARASKAGHLVCESAAHGLTKEGNRKGFRFWRALDEEVKAVTDRIAGINDQDKLNEAVVAFSAENVPTDHRAWAFEHAETAKAVLDQILGKKA